MDQVDRENTVSFIEALLMIGLDLRNLDNSALLGRSPEPPAVAVEPPPRAGSPYDDTLKSMWKE